MVVIGSWFLRFCSGLVLFLCFSNGSVGGVLVVCGGGFCYGVSAAVPCPGGGF